MDSRKRQKLEEFPYLRTNIAQNFGQRNSNDFIVCKQNNSNSFVMHTVDKSEEYHSNFTMEETKSNQLSDIQLRSGIISSETTTNTLNQTYYNVSGKLRTAFVMEPMKTSNSFQLNAGNTQNLIEYRLISQLPVNSSELSNKTDSKMLNIQSNGCGLPVQLVNKCGEIFVIKGLVNSPSGDGNISSNIGNVSVNSETSINCYPTALQRIPSLITPKPIASHVDIENQTLSEHNASTKIKILESCKKRDDKRRVNHNETERRRRDKINYWIFKLKELIPPDGVANQQIDSDAASLSENIEEQKKGCNTVSRNSSNGSKSQILVKACEYLKEMQQEIKSLRECLVENEGLRLSNQQLQNELDQLKNSTASNKNGKLKNKTLKRSILD